MKDFFTFMKQALSNGEPSSKRIIAFLGALVIFGMTIYLASEELIDATLIIVLTALGGIAATNIFEHKKPKE